MAFRLVVASVLCFSAYRGRTVYAALSSSQVPEAYSSWLSLHATEYDRSTYVGNDDEVAVHWKIDGDKMNLAVAVEASGWLGFGIAEAGGMPGSDIVLFSASNNELLDTFSTSYGAPEEDTCQDWELVRSIVEPGFIMFESTRLLVTGDMQDRDITDDSDISTPAHRVIAAWGDTDDVMYHADSRAAGAIRFFGAGDVSDPEGIVQAVAKTITEGEVGNIDLTAGNFTIPQDETTLQDFCFSLEDLKNLGFPVESEVHMITADFVPDERTRDLVHHLTLHGSDDDDACEKKAYQYLYIWAPGAEPFHLPSNVGIPMGQNGYKSFRLNIHYDNRHGVINKVDNSGVRLTYTTNLREHNAGTIALGALNTLDGQTVGNGITQHEFSCPGSCTQTHLPDKVTVFYEMLHMHERGARMTNHHRRNGGTEEIRDGSVDYYDFDQNGCFPVKQDHFELHPGDDIKTTCYFDGADGRVFGEGSRDEMCVAFLFYYPAVEKFHGVCGLGLSKLGDPTCEASYSNITLVSEEDMGRSFGISDGMCTAGDQTDAPDYERQSLRGDGDGDGDSSGGVLAVSNRWNVLAFGFVTIILSTLT